MANTPAVLAWETSLPIPFTVANATGIEKGTLLRMTDPRTAIAPTAAGQVFAGVAAEEKIASDGKTTIGVYREGIFISAASGSITVGDSLCFSGNLICLAGINEENIAGISLETAANGETLLWELRPNHLNIA